MEYCKRQRVSTAAFTVRPTTTATASAALGDIEDFCERVTKRSSPTFVTPLLLLPDAVPVRSQLQYFVDRNMFILQQAPIISASWYTDMPKMMLREFLTYSNIHGCFPVRTPYFKSTRYADMRPETVKVICWWTKDPENLLNAFVDSELSPLMGQYTHMVQFTINGSITRELFELGLKRTLEQSIMQLDELISHVTKDGVVIRFGPIICWLDINRVQHDNVDDLEEVLPFLVARGFKEINVSFMRSKKRATIVRMEKHNIFGSRCLGKQDKIDMVNRLAAIGDKFGVVLKTCDTDIIADLGIIDKVSPAFHIELSRVNKLLTSAGKPQLLVDSRTLTKECMKFGPVQVFDVGGLISCANGCLYCDNRPMNIAAHSSGREARVITIPPSSPVISTSPPPLQPMVDDDPLVL